MLNKRGPFPHAQECYSRSNETSSSNAERYEYFPKALFFVEFICATNTGCLCGSPSGCGGGQSCLQPSFGAQPWGGKLGWVNRGAQSQPRAFTGAHSAVGRQKERAEQHWVGWGSSLLGLGQWASAERTPDLLCLRLVFAKVSFFLYFKS